MEMILTDGSIHHIEVKKDRNVYIHIYCLIYIPVYLLLMVTDMQIAIIIFILPDPR